MLDQVQSRTSYTAGEHQTGTTNDLILLLGRILIAVLFLPSGFEKLTNVGGFATSLATRGIPEAVSYPVAALAAATEFFAPLALLLGFQVWAVSLLLALFTVIAALISHRYWEFADAAVRRMQSVNFYKNIGIVGGLLAFSVAGAGRFSIDAMIRRRR
jgi:putative oxidoreductase